MNGIHDLGGMHGFGPVAYQPAEPVFHAPWEAAALAMQRAVTGPVCTIDEFRHAVERLPPARYLSATYYERWLDALALVLTEKGVLAPEALEARTAFFLARPDAPATAALAEPPAPPVAGPARTGLESFVRPGAAPPRFGVGDRVVTRNHHPTGHTRLPRYARGKRGVVVRDLGTQVFPDAHAHGRGEAPEPLYSVRFAGRELWGEASEPGLSVHVDLWESYLLPG
jgi:nitrile hydratase beta subunit